MLHPPNRYASLPAVRVAALVALAMSAAACPEVGEPIVPQDGLVNAIMSNATGGIWPGGVTRMPDGRFYVVYERKAPNARAFGRVMPDLLGTPGDEEHVAGGEGGRGAFDPGVAALPTGDLVISWANTAIGVYLVERDENGSLGPSLQTAPRSYGQATLSEVNGNVLLVYNYIPPGSRFGAHYDNDVLVRRVFDADRVGEPVLAGGPAGSGTDGNQFRVNASATGNPGEALVVWNRPSSPPGGDRTIWGALSPDNGGSWGQPFPIAEMEGDDLVNPYAINVESARQLRVYFVNRHGGGGSDLNVVTSEDRGTTWSDPEEVPHPEGARGSPARPVFIEVDGRVICFASWVVEGENILGTFVVP